MRLPQLELPALALTSGGAIVALPSGETRAVSASEARDVLTRGDVLTCHALFMAQRLSARLTKPVLDVLELFAFVRPGEPCLPSPLGLARALALREPRTPEQSARGLHEVATALFDRLGPWFTLLSFGAAPDADLVAAAARAGVPLAVVRLDQSGLAAIYCAPQILVRPDQHVAWRGREAGSSAGAIVARCLGWP